MSNLIVTNIESQNLQTQNINGGQLAGHRNRLINPFTENQRALTSVADDTYCLDRWYVLTESGNVTVAQTVDPESGAPFGIRLTQPDVTAKRLGLAQIIESKNIRQYASQAMNLFARVKLSGATAIRYAIIEHTGTLDVVTSDVVNSWTSGTFTAGNFFIAGINILKTGTVTPGAAVWGDVDDWSVLGSGVKNVIIFIWSESTLAQNGTLDISRPQYEPGVVATPHEWRMNELQLCLRHARLNSDSVGYAFNATAVSGVQVSFELPMFAAPAAQLLAGGVGALHEPGIAFRNASGLSTIIGVNGGYMSCTSSGMTAFRMIHMLPGFVLFTAEL